MSGLLRGDRAKVGDPRAEEREEDLVGHRDRDLAALDGLGALVGGLELGVHPFLPEESGAILGDAVTAHEADGFAHHRGAMAGVPELGGGAKDVGLGVEDEVLDERVGLEGFVAGGVAHPRQAARRGR